MDTYSSTYTVRRFLAIGLVILIIVFLFWPSIIRVNGRSELFRTFFRDADRMSKSEFGEYFAREWTPNAVGTAAADAEKAREVGMELYDFLTDENYALSFARVCRFLPKMLQYSGAVDLSFPIALGIMLNLYFFIILAFAAAAIPMMLLNKSKACNIVLVVFTAQAGVSFLLIGLYGLVEALSKGGIEGASVLPGASAFLLPVCAIAALILYKRPKPEPESPLAEL